MLVSFRVHISWVIYGNVQLAICPLGPVTANGVDLLTEIYVIYIEANTSHIARCFGYGKIRSLCPLAAAGERVTHAWKEGRKLEGKLGNI